ncbi:MAG: GGDEF domain-containing protein, partial [Rhizomicrobium sp.]
IAQSKAGIDHEADYRALKKDGGYVWIRDVVHVVRNEAGEVDSLVGFMFDISERKEAEQKLEQLKRELEQLSLTDGLTGIANRRCFDQCLAEEWADSARRKIPLSMVILDIDYFKQYNDVYGHVDGDECLKRVANVLRDVAQRPRDLVARFGGEEFILLLPETDSEAAHRLAEVCQSRIAELGIAHAKSAVSEVVTASIGVGTAVGTTKSSAREFIEAVDRALYAAKHGGRNRIELAEAALPSV